MPSFKIEKSTNGFILHSTKPEFRILQVTDMHFGVLFGRKKTQIREIRHICDHYDVDLVVNTGDYWGGRAPFYYIKHVCKMFDEHLGYPWAFAWGNHDNEISTEKDWMGIFDKIETYLASLPNCLYVPSRNFIEKYGSVPIDADPREAKHVTPFLRGEKGLSRKDFNAFYGGNYKIQLTNPENDNGAWEIFLMNSRRIHGIPPKALAWMQNIIHKNSPKLPAIVFYHVPHLAYQEILTKRTARGIYRERVCFDGEDGRIHQKFQEMGSIKAAFVGHDHVNDYYADLNGIDVVYGRKSSTMGYGGQYRKTAEQMLAKGGRAIPWGAKLITLGLNAEIPEKNTLSHKTILHDLTEWSYPDNLDILPGLKW